MILGKYLCIKIQSPKNFFKIEKKKKKENKTAKATSQDEKSRTIYQSEED